MTFDVAPVSEGTRLMFRHASYAQSPCYEVCVEGWRYFLIESLKPYVETGRGAPYDPATWNHDQRSPQ